MPKTTTTRPKPKKKAASGALMVRLDRESKELLAQAARLRKTSLSDYVRTVTVTQARREVLEARELEVALTPEEQLAFWKALHEPVRLTPAQKKLGKVMRGEE